MTSLKCALIALIMMLCELIDKLTELLEKACGPCEDSLCPVSLNGPQGGDASWVTGPDAGSALTYPTPIDTNIRDWATVISATEADLKECCAAHTPESAVTVRFHMQHWLYGTKHTGFTMTTSAGQFTATSPTNTSPLGGTLPGTTVGVGTPPGPEDTGFVDRWVEVTATCKDFIAGVTLSTFAFEGVNTIGVYDEQLNGISAEIVAIEGC